MGNRLPDEPPAIAAPGQWLAAIVLLTTAARLFLGYVYFGFHTGDDVEILEAGFLRALGWPYEPWAIRNLLVSDLLVAPVLRLGAARSATAAADWPSVVLIAGMALWKPYIASLSYDASIASMSDVVPAGSKGASGAVESFPPQPVMRPIRATTARDRIA